MQKLDFSTAALSFAEHDSQRVGDAVVALDNAAPGGATLWDIRVLPGLRRRGIAAALYAAAGRMGAYAWMPRPCRRDSKHQQAEHPQYSSR